MAELAFLDVKVSRLNFSVLHGKTDGTAVGFKWGLTKGHSGKLTKSSEVKCCEQILVYLLTRNFEPGSRRIHVFLLPVKSIHISDGLYVDFTLLTSKQHR